MPHKLLALCVAGALAGCGGDPATATDAPSSKATLDCRS